MNDLAGFAFALSLAAAAPLAAQGPLPGEAPAGAFAELAALARARQGEAGARAAAFLAEHRPAADTDLPLAWLASNLELAFLARERFPWARDVPEELFLNDVLPYAVLDETREDWRPAMIAAAGALVADCETASEAAQALNRGLFDRLGVHYDTRRKKPNQSPAESLADGRASCTGLTILLVDACRAVGIPARAAGVASWHDSRGNHTWVEVWDGEWHFTGADEHDPAGLDRAWFTADAARAVAGDPRHAVWASSWRRTGAHFPLVWAPRSRSVPAVDVTARYAPLGAARSELARVSVRVRSTAGGDRIVAELVALDGSGAEVGRGTSRAGRADLNDMPVFELAPGAYALAMRASDETRRIAFEVAGAEPITLDVDWSAAGLAREGAEELVARLAAEARERVSRELAPELAAGEVALGEHALRFKEKRFGAPPSGGPSLWISLHGGGGAPTAVNDRQWANQLRLYEPSEGIYVAPRAPTDTWNLWHQAHVDGLFDRLIAGYVAVHGVDPNRVYLLGYSAGGDGVYQLAPRMADRFAAAAMMAGHPNEAEPLGLRNLPFAMFVGGKDEAYERNAKAPEWNARLDALQAADPAGYPHRLTLYPDHGHWMNGDDREALPWMAGAVRDPWPERVVWYQDDVTGTRFYWLQVAPPAAVAGRTIKASVEGQSIELTTEDYDAVTLRLRDALIDLDRPIEVRVNGRSVFAGTVARDRSAIERSLAERIDAASAATALLALEW